MPHITHPNDRPVALCLMGPTASGKTALAQRLYDELPVDLISVDSAQVYRGMDIGTAKPTAEELLALPHRLIDIRDPSEAYSAAMFREDALREISEIHQAGRTPLLVGGTMLYFRALEYGLSPLPEADPEVRKRLDAEASELGWPEMHARLQAIDPDTAARLQPTDPQRIQRALEIYEITGEQMSVLLAAHEEPELPFQLVKIAITPDDRGVLHERIAARFLHMMNMGFLQEVRTLFQCTDLHENLPSIRCVGYRQLWKHLQGEWDLDTAIERGIAATRQLAKRQLTWLRGDETWTQFNSESKKLGDEILKLIKNHPI